MDQQEQWHTQRLALFRQHVQELKDNALENAQARQALVNRYQEEKTSLNPSGWAASVTRFAEQLNQLVRANREKRRGIMQRQKQESAELEERIKAEQHQMR